MRILPIYIVATEVKNRLTNILKKYLQVAAHCNCKNNYLRNQQWRGYHRRCFDPGTFARAGYADHRYGGQYCGATIISAPAGIYARAGYSCGGKPFG
jgi:hypothetical protein